MDNLIRFVKLYNVQITLGLIIGFLLILALYIISEMRMRKVKNKYKTLVNGMENINIEELLIQTGKDINEMNQTIETLKDKISSIQTKLSFAIQKVGIVRYNAFFEMGSDLSFSIALLDNFESGFVITSIYGREHSSVYAKPVKFGRSEYPLSEEETLAIDRAKLGESKELIL